MTVKEAWSLRVRATGEVNISALLVRGWGGAQETATRTMPAISGPIEGRFHHDK
jgi:hypothetical protein